MTAKKRGRGRPTALDDVLEARVLEALRGGNFRETAARYAGVSPSTLRHWMRRGLHKPKSRCGIFRRRVMEVEQAAQIRAVALVLKAAASDAKHAEWWLERKFPELWGRKDSVRAELSGHVGVDGLADLLLLGHDDEDDEEQRDAEPGRAPAPEPKDPSEGEGPS